ncbi:MAG: cytochrome c biogenesis protein CcsA [Solibacillus sp.]
MTDVVMKSLYELMVILYALSLVLYFVDYLYKNVRARRMAFWLVSIVWVLQTVFFIIFMIETRRFPILSLFEGVYFYAWLLTTISIVLHCIARVDLPVFFVNILSFVFLTIYLFAPVEESQIVVDSLVSEMLVIHISFAMLSYVAFSVSFVFSVLYLILYRILKQKKFNNLWSRLPNLQQMSNWMSNSVLLGVPLLIISLILGLEWGLMTLEGLSVFDIKIIGSFIVAVMYLVILILHRNGILVGTAFAYVQIYMFLLIVINFFLGSRLSDFHLWI